MQLDRTAMSGPDFLDALADAEAANGNDVNAEIYRSRAHQWKRDQLDLQRAEARASDAESRLADMRRTAQAA